jgi:hypothetical protein
MPGGVKIKREELKTKLEKLDIDEGIRVERRGKKIFINRRASGDYVIQDGDTFHYLDNSKQVIALLKLTRETAAAATTIWLY